MVNPIKAVKAVKNFTGGKKGRAIENKVRKEFGMSKGGNTAGKQKAINKAAKLNTKIEKYSDGQYYVTPNRAGNKIVFTGNRIKEIPITGSNKKINKNLREAVFKAGGKGKLTNKPIVRLKKIEKKTTKVPVKRRGK
jgi:hypothetical protein